MIRAKHKAAAKESEGSGQSAGHGIRKARKSQTVSIEEGDARRHEERLRREAHVAVADAATNNAPTVSFPYATTDLQAISTEAWFD